MRACECSPDIMAMKGSESPPDIAAMRGLGAPREGAAVRASWPLDGITLHLCQIHIGPKWVNIMKVSRPYFTWGEVRRTSSRALRYLMM